MNPISWGIKNSNIVIKIYTWLYLIWAIFIFLMWTGTAISELHKLRWLVTFSAYIVGLLLLVVLPFIPIYILYWRSKKSSQKKLANLPPPPPP
jgi:hypothetical protein